MAEGLGLEAHRGRGGGQDVLGVAAAAVGRKDGAPDLVAHVETSRGHSCVDDDSGKVTAKGQGKLVAVITAGHHVTHWKRQNITLNQSF